MRITQERIVKMAHNAAQSAYKEIISNTDVDQPTALCAAKDAGDEFARMMVLTLTEHGVEITK